jgi:preprotein translocase subunit YajC
MGFADSFSMRALYNKAKRERTQQRETKLVAAVQAGFRTGARILISNGTTGTIIKVNRTRVKVKGDDGRMWSVPPRCMTLVKGK